MSLESSPNRPVKTTQTSFGILEIIQENNGAALDKIASEMDLARSTVHDHLTTLEDLGCLVRQEEEYTLGLRLFDHGMKAKSRFRTISSKVKPVIERLTTETDEVVWFIVEENGYAVYLDVAKGEYATPSPSRLGRRQYLHTMATGKAILAHLPEERVERILDQHGLPSVTEHTITDVEELYTVLDQVRDQGVAFNDEELTTGIRAIGSAIVVDGQVIGAIGISGPSTRLSEEHLRKEHSKMLRGATNEIEMKIQHSSVEF